MRDVAVVSFAQAPSVRRDTERNEVEILTPVVREGIARSGIPRTEIGVTVCAPPPRNPAGPPISDGAAAIVLAAGDLPRRVCPRPAWIRGIDHRIEAHGLGVRDLTTSPSTAFAAGKASVSLGDVDVAELHAPFTHQELILKDALGLDDGVAINPSGGALAANPVMVAGLLRIGEAARHNMDGSAKRAVAHATS